MTEELIVLSFTALSIGFLHTLFGPDHYVPFIVMSKARNWNFPKTAFITFLCGIGHILGSIALGIIGVAFGVALANLELIESVRGEYAAWFLIAFGLVYFVWGMRRAFQKKGHSHILHSHDENGQHREKNITPWILFLIFVLGPCEPLIPLLMYPAAKESVFGLIIVTSIFGIATIGTMLAMVAVSYYGLNFVPIKKLEQYTHAMAGAAVFLCGASIQFLGL